MLAYITLIPGVHFFFVVPLFIHMNYGVSAQVAPKVVPSMRPELSLRRSQRYHVICAVSEGDLPLNFHWVKNGQPLVETSDISVRRLDDFSSSLTISSVREDHAGNYTCIASNMVGTDSYTTKLKVLVPPAWLRQPHDLSVLSGGRVTLNCEAVGNPRPTYSWKRTKGLDMQNMEPLLGSRWRTHDDGSLTISEIRKEEEGFYSCESFNGVGDGLKKTIRLEVQVPPNVHMSAPVLSVKKGTRTEFACNATGDSPLIVTWEKGKQKIEHWRNGRLKMTDHSFETGIYSVIVIEKTERADSALYTCAARNSFGNSAASIRLSVIEHPGSPVELTATELWSRSVRLKWKQPYNGNSIIKKYLIFYWIKSSTKSEQQKTEIESSQTSFRVRNLKPFTTYEFQVSAENEVGQSEVSQPVVITTHEEEPEAPPVNVRNVEKGATFVHLKWKAPPMNLWNGDLKGFYVGYKTPGSSSRNFSYRTVISAEEDSEYQFLLSGLRPVTTYAVIVRMFNAVGMGPPSEQFLVKTSYGDPPVVPVVTIAATRHSSADVKIHSEKRKKSPPSEYVLHLREKGGQWQQVPLPLSPSQTYSLGGLVSSVQYQLYVTAKNQFGDSGPTDVLSFKTEKSYKGSFLLPPEEEGTPFYQKLSFIIPVAVSLTIIIVVPLAACCCLHKLTSLPPIDTEGVEARGFTYTPAPAPPSQHEPLNAPQNRSLPRAPPPNQSTYSTLQNYGSVMEDDDPRYDSVMEEMKTFINAKSRPPECS